LRLLLVRHGRTRSNAEGRYQGSIDTPLDEVGREQARALDAELPRDLDLVLTSLLRRARETAEIFCAARALPLAIEPEFRERSVGIYEGLTATEIRERHADLWTRDVARSWHEAPPGGEPIGVLVARVEAALAGVRERYAERRVVLIAHGFVARAVRAICLGRADDWFGWQLDNAAVLEVEIPAMPVDRERLRAELARAAAAAPDPGQGARPTDAARPTAVGRSVSG
jgi:probable phosphoglycerate mutase